MRMVKKLLVISLMALLLLTSHTYAGDPESIEPTSVPVYETHN